MACVALSADQVGVASFAEAMLVLAPNLGDTAVGMAQAFPGHGLDTWSGHGITSTATWNRRHMAAKVLQA